jgi:hypothetical protein
VAVLNPPPGLVLPGVVAAATAADADAVVAFVVRQDDLGLAAQVLRGARAESDRGQCPGQPAMKQVGRSIRPGRCLPTASGSL